MTGKNPISCLQEYLAGKHLPLPVYVEEGFGVNFTCICRANGITTMGQSTNKKGAKQEAATKAFEILTGGVHLFPAEVKRSITTVIINHHQQPVLNHIEPHLENYVGQLNEYSSKNGMSYPKYNFLTCYNLGGPFVYQCEFLGHKREGTASTKKDAKQQSAKAMLQMIESESPTLQDGYRSTAFIKKEVHVENSERIINLFNSLSTTPTKTCQRINENIMDADSSIQIAGSLELMKEELRNHGIQYKIKDLPAKDGNFVVSLVVDNTDFTLYGAGRTKHDAITDALHTILLIKKRGCSLTEPSLYS